MPGPRIKRGNSANRDATTIEQRERQREALELRKAGKNFDQIAEALGFAERGGAYRCVQAAIKEIIKEPAEDVIRLELERLDALLDGVWSKATAGDPQAVASALRLMERRAKYLGLDAADKLEMTLPDPEKMTPAQLQSAIHAMIDARARLVN